jgi:hypothetical protein
MVVVPAAVVVIIFYLLCFLVVFVDLFLGKLGPISLRIVNKNKNKNSRMTETNRV